MPPLISEGGIDMKTILGGKGAGLCELSKIGVPVPPGFVITTDTCLEYYSNHRTLPQDILQEISSAISDMEKLLNKKFGAGPDPLLVSCRSGARISMPGMMDTVLNIGFTPEVLECLKNKYGEIFTLDTYRRFLHMFGTIVLGICESKFKKVSNSSDINILKNAVSEYEKICGDLIPKKPIDQLLAAVKAVFDSWYNERAEIYRRTYDIPENWGTAASIVSMVYGNKNEKSGTGVVFSRNPSTGENFLFGDYLSGAQGEDVVRGSVTPEKIGTLENKDPEIFNEIKETARKLENYFKDVQDIEFTLDDGKLWILQTRSAKRTAQASVKIAHDLHVEGVFDCEVDALKLIRAEDLEQFLSPCFDHTTIKKEKEVASGIPASPGAACGRVVFSAKKAIEMHEKNPDETYILVRPETVPDDIGGMKASVGFLTAVGGASSHAALVARQMGKPCIVGCADLSFKYENNQIAGAELGKSTFKEMDYLSIDGQTGKIYLAKIPTVIPDVIDKKNKYSSFNWVLETCDIRRRIGVWTNADNAEQCRAAIKLGAEGVGLCRTEHQFFDAVAEFQTALLSDDPSSTEKANKDLLDRQTNDFYLMFKEMSGLPLTIRLLDPPLHEFLPKEEGDFVKMSNFSKIPVEKIKAVASKMKESNPMLGFRGCRLGILKKEITELQIDAIFSAARLAKKEGYFPVPQIMVPLAGTSRELKIIYDQVKSAAKEKHPGINYHLGAMIELPRACIVADEIARISDFISFGTNDLTQTALGISRDDCSSFMEQYIKNGVYPKDPFQSLDVDGVGYLINLAVNKARETNPNIKIGICGEHGGDPDSIKFFRSLGFDYVSCSPKRIPTAKLSAIL
jgi:pyruvate,orthophosphate dikinase